MSEIETTSDAAARICLVLDRIKEAVIADIDDAEMYALALDEMLTNMQNEDAFGTEGQCDPRGDQRNGEWSMGCVEGFDDNPYADEVEE